MTTYCPHCGNVIRRVVIAGVEGNANVATWNCISLNCPSCHKSLGVQIDPIAIKNDIVSELKRR